MIGAVILDKMLVPKGNTLGCVGEHWEVFGQEKLVDFHVDNVSLVPKVQAVSEPAWGLHAAGMTHGNHHLLGTWY